MILTALLLHLAASPLDDILADPALQGAQVGAYVCEVGGAKLYGRNEAIRMQPASNEKLLTGSFALTTLGPDYHPVTRFWVRADRLEIDSTGDPGMNYSDLLDIKSKLKLDGTLPVWLHETYRPGVPPSWELDDLPNRYAAPITAFSANRGGVELFGEADKFTIEPFDFGIKAVRVTSTGPRHVDYDPFTGIAQVFGDLPTKRTRLDTLSVHEPDRQAALVLGKDVKFVDAAPTDDPTYVTQGHALKDILRDCLVRSDNQIAENLLLMATAKSADVSHDPYTKASAAVKAFLVGTVGVQAGDIRPYDGSGMSRHNMVTTRALAQILVWFAGQPNGDIWKGCLDVPGGGTLVGRLDKSTFRGKTGTLEGVVALTGYVTLADGKEAVVSLVFNDALADSKTLRDVADRFVRAVEAKKSTEFGGATPSRLR